MKESTKKFYEISLNTTGTSVLISVIFSHLITNNIFYQYLSYCISGIIVLWLLWIFDKKHITQQIKEYKYLLRKERIQNFFNKN